MSPVACEHGQIATGADGAGRFGLALVKDSDHRLSRDAGVALLIAAVDLPA